MQNQPITINVNKRTFIGPLKMGDTIAALNVLQHIRNIRNNQQIKFYIPDDALHSQPDNFVVKFKNYLHEMTDCISVVSGQEMLSDNIELWSYREAHGEHFVINNQKNQKKKICIFPLIDAQYNTERNWSSELIAQLIEKYSDAEYNEYERIVGIKNINHINGISLGKFIISTDFLENLNHIVECSHYIGGDTGLSHFASVLSDEKNLTYYYSEGNHGSWSSNFTRPFYLTVKNGNLIFYKK